MRRGRWVDVNVWGMVGWGIRERRVEREVEVEGVDIVDRLDDCLWKRMYCTLGWGSEVGVVGGFIYV